MALSLTRETEEMLRNELSRGRFASADEAVRAGLAMLELERESTDSEPGSYSADEQDRLRNQIAIGMAEVAGGDTLDFDVDAIWREAERPGNEQEKKAL